MKINYKKYYQKRTSVKCIEERPVITAVWVTWPSLCFTCIQFPCPYLAPASHIGIPNILTVLTKFLPFAFFEKMRNKRKACISKYVRPSVYQAADVLKLENGRTTLKITYTCISHWLRLQIYLEIPKITTRHQPQKWVQHQQKYGQFGKHTY